MLEGNTEVELKCQEKKTRTVIFFFSLICNESLFVAIRNYKHKELYSAECNATGLHAMCQAQDQELQKERQTRPSPVPVLKEVTIMTDM